MQTTTRQHAFAIVVLLSGERTESVRKQERASNSSNRFELPQNAEGIRATSKQTLRLGLSKVEASTSFRYTLTENCSSRCCDCPCFIRHMRPALSSLISTPRRKELGRHFGPAPRQCTQASKSHRRCIARTSSKCTTCIRQTTSTLSNEGWSRTCYAPAHMNTHAHTNARAKICSCPQNP